jgi:hypothetical protein
MNMYCPEPLQIHSNTTTFITKIVLTKICFIFQPVCPSAGKLLQRYTKDGRSNIERGPFLIYCCPVSKKQNKQYSGLKFYKSWTFLFEVFALLLSIFVVEIFYSFLKWSSYWIIKRLISNL